MEKLSADRLKSLLPEDITPEETQKLTKAFKDPKFAELFQDYLKEISDPNQREENEKYLMQMEAENTLPSDCQLLKPEPFRCLKGVSSAGKFFVNICHSSLIDDPTPQRAEQGVYWHIPYSKGAVRKFTLQGKDEVADVVEVVFATKTMQLGQKTQRFEQLIIDSAIDAVKSDVLVDFRGFKVLKKCRCKGGPPAIMRMKKSSAKGQAEAKQDDEVGPKIVDMTETPDPKKVTTIGEDQNEAKTANAPTKQDTTEDGLEVPKFEIVHVGSLGVQDFVCSDVVRHEAFTQSRRLPSSLVVNIQLPKMKSIGEADLDVSSTALCLQVQDTYAVKIDLPFEVKSEQGSAKFFRKTGILRVTLPVQKPPKPEPIPFKEPVPEAPEPDEEQVEEQTAPQKKDGRNGEPHMALDKNHLEPVSALEEIQDNVEGVMDSVSKDTHQTQHYTFTEQELTPGNNSEEEGHQELHQSEMAVSEKAADSADCGDQDMDQELSEEGEPDEEPPGADSSKVEEMEDNRAERLEPSSVEKVESLATSRIGDPSEMSNVGLVNEMMFELD